MIRRWSDGKDGALDVTVTGPLARSNVAAAAEEAGSALAKAVQRTNHFFQAFHKMKIIQKLIYLSKLSRKFNIKHLFV